MDRSPLDELAEERSRTSVPLSELTRLVARNISRRFVRTILTMSGIILSIAFFTTLASAGAALSAIGEGTQVETYHWWMLSLAIIVAAAGITNSVLMAVAERTREIGTMKVLGATNSQTVLILVLENALIGAIGGALGYVIGVAAGAVLNRAAAGGISAFFGMIGASLFLKILLQSLALATTLAIVSSAYPAHKATRMSPEDAMRAVV